MIKILLISGHGGSPYDPGAGGCGYTEALETRWIANNLKPELEKYGFFVDIYDQSKNAYQELKNGRGRAFKAKIAGFDYVFEIHLNAAANDQTGNGKITGSEIWVHVTEQGTTVEQNILAEMAKLGFKNRGVKESNSLLVQKTVKNAGISHALLETCFIDDKDDMNLYASKQFQIVQAVARGIAVGYGVYSQNNQTEKPTKKEVPEMTRAEYDALNPYISNIDNVPVSLKQETEEMIAKGFLIGNGKDTIGLRLDSLRAVIISYRMWKEGAK